VGVTVAAPVMGSTTPRLSTPPLVVGPPGPCGCGCALTPETSLGFEAVAFATDVLGVDLLGWQRYLYIHALELTPNGRYRFRTIVTLVARQQGKALDTQTPMLTTSGWSTMGDLKVGDEVYHPDGHPARVVGAYDVMHDRPCYRVTMTDGRSVVADADHLWTVQDQRHKRSPESWAAGREVRAPRGERRSRVYQWETLTTGQLLERGVMRFDRPRKGGGRQREFAYRLPVQHAVISKPVDLPIDPYLLGAWLGDGSSQSSCLTVGDQDIDETIALVEATGARIVARRRERTAWHVRFNINGAMRDGFESRARKLGVWADKHVPDMYLTAGTEQRLALLQGLMDTDGSIYVTGTGTARAEFCSSRRDLAEGVLYLARSLGWRATVRESAAMLNGAEVGRRWRVCFTPQEGDPIPFRLQRKAHRVQAARSRGGELHAVSIASIEPVESRPVRCIKVDRPDGLFLAGRDLVATHNTVALKILALWAMYMDHARMVLGAAQSLDIARESWQGAVELAEGVDELRALIAPNGVRRANGEQCLTLRSGARYRITAATRSAGRGLSVDLLILDELREHRNADAWAALSKTTMARPDALIFGISNAGDVESTVLNGLRAAALAEADPSLGLFEWSAPYGCALDDVDGWAQAMPGLGVTIDERAVRTALATDPEAVFRTELLCQTVDALDAAIDGKAWQDCRSPGLTLAPLRERMVCCVDVALDGGHVSLVGAAVAGDGRAHVEVLAGWESIDAARVALPDLLTRLQPKDLGWFPSGPSAALGADLRAWRRKVRLSMARFTRDPGNGRRILVTDDEEEATRIQGAMDKEACQGFAALVLGRRVAVAPSELLDQHVAAAQKVPVGDGWRFGRQGKSHVDCAYAAAGAVYLAQLLPPQAPIPRAKAF
jgi:hypothetical protein